MKDKEIKKLKISILGKFQKLWTSFFLKQKLKSLGLDLHEMNHYSWDHTEIVVSGEKGELWKFIKSSKRPLFFVQLDKIVFTFVD